MITLRKLSTLFVFSLFLLVLGACNQVEGETDLRTESFSVPVQYNLDVDTFNGSIEIVEGQSNRVIVEATIRQPQQLEYEAGVDGDTLKIRAVATKTNTNPSPGVSLVITSPPEASLTLRSSNGSIQVNGVGNGGDIETSNGSVIMQRVSGLYVINTSNGRIELVRVTGSFGAQTSNGSIQFEGELDPDTNTLLRTSNGSINVDIGPDANVEIDAETSNGDVEVDYPLSNATLAEKKIMGTLGTGSAKLKLRTSNGNVNLR
jgi:DUF4097 and DUF4098 domain-containing protein YvlB